MIKSYARVSTHGQTLDAQQAVLREGRGNARIRGEAIRHQDGQGCAGALLGLARGRRHGRGDEVGSAGAVNAGLAQHPRHHWRSWGELQVSVILGRTAQHLMAS